MIALRLAGSYLPGFGSITIAVLLLGGIQLMAIGLIGEYVGRIYDEVKGRPLYLVRARRTSPSTRRREPSPTDVASAAGGIRAARGPRRLGAVRASAPAAASCAGVDAALGERALLERADAARQPLDRVGDRVGQVDPVGVGPLRPAAVDAHRMAGVADDGRVRRHVVDHDRVGADLRAVADGDRAEQLGARADRDVVLDGRVALAASRSRCRRA